MCQLNVECLNVGRKDIIMEASDEGREVRMWCICQYFLPLLGISGNRNRWIARNEHLLRSRLYHNSQVAISIKRTEFSSNIPNSPAHSLSAVDKAADRVA